MPFDAVILAGGRSARMGVDKATLPIRWGGQWLPAGRAWQRRLAPHAGQVWTSRRSGQKDGFSNVIEDRSEQYHPLNGLEEALRRTTEEFVLVVPVDVWPGPGWHILPKPWRSQQVFLFAMVPRSMRSDVSAAIANNASVRRTFEALPELALPQLRHENHAAAWENPVTQMAQDLPIPPEQLPIVLASEQRRQRAHGIEWPRTTSNG